MGALRSSGAARNSFLAYLADRVELALYRPQAVVQTLADPVYLSSFAKPSDVTAGLWDIDLAVARFNAAAPFTAGQIGWLKIDSIARARAALSSSITGLTFQTNNPQVTTVPSECGFRLTGALSAGIIQFKGSTPAANAWSVLCSGPNNHGVLDVEDIWAMGDPTLAAGTADANALFSFGLFYEFYSRRFRIMGFLGASQVLLVSSMTYAEVMGWHLSGCGALASGGATAANIYVQGFEQGWNARGWINNTVQPPSNIPAPANKNVATTPWILRGPSVGSAAASGAGDTWEEMAAGDATSAALQVNSSVLGGGVTGVGPQRVVNFYANGNCASTSGPGALSFQGVQGGVLIEGGRVRINGGTATPAVSFLGDIPFVHVSRHRVDFGFGYFFGATGAQVGDTIFEQCSTDQTNPNIPILLSTATINGTTNVATTPPAELRMSLSGTVNTTNAAQTATLIQVPILPGTTASWSLHAQARATTAPSGGSTGDTVIFDTDQGAKNVGGTLTEYNAAAPTSKLGDASMNIASVTIPAPTATGALVNVQVNQGNVVGNNNTWIGHVEVLMG